MKKLAAIGLILMGLFWLLPAYFTVQTSFMSKFTSPLNLWGHAHLENWRTLPWNTLGGWAFNSLIVCAIAGCLTPVVCISAGYAFVRYEFPGKEQIFYAFLLAIAMPGIVLFLPRYLLVAKVGLTGSYAGLILPVIMSPALVFLSRQYLSHIDISIIEAARLDGASELRIFRSIVLPLSIPLVVLGVITGFGASYGDFMWQYLVGREIKTLTVGIGIFILSTAESAATGGGEILRGHTGISYESLKAATSVLQSLPPLILFIVGQKYFIKGLNIGTPE